MWGREERERERRRGEGIERRQWRRECEAQRVSFLSVSPPSGFGEAKQRVYSRCLGTCAARADNCEVSSFKMKLIIIIMEKVTIA